MPFPHRSPSFVAAIPVGPEPRFRWSARSEVRTNDLDGRRSVELPGDVCEVEAPVAEPSRSGRYAFGFLASSAAIPGPGPLWETGCLSLQVGVPPDVGLQPVEPDGGGPDQVEQRV
jgi:hypothetical protein